MEDLATAGLEYRENTMEILRRQALQKQQKVDLMSLFHKFPNQLQTDESTGSQYFEIFSENEGKDVIIELVIEEKETLKTRVAEA